MNAIPFTTKPSFTVADITDTYKWNEKNKKVVSLVHNREKLFFTSAGDSDNHLDKSLIRKYLIDIDQQEWDSLEQLFECVGKITLSKSTMKYAN